MCRRECDRHEYRVRWYSAKRLERVIESRLGRTPLSGAQHDAKIVVSYPKIRKSQHSNTRRHAIALHDQKLSFISECLDYLRINTCWLPALGGLVDPSSKRRLYCQRFGLSTFLYTFKSTFAR